MTTLDHINKIIIYQISKYMALDVNARRNLEITEKMRDKSKKGTLLWVLDKTATSMGARNLRRWLSDPLIDTIEINQRLEAVKELKDDVILRGDVVENLKKVYDIERLAGKMAYGNANARDMITLRNSLERLPEVKKLLSQSKSEMLKNLYEDLDELPDILELIKASIVDDPPMTVKDGGIIKLGYDEEIDKLKTATTEGKNWIIALEAEEREKTGIKNLKVGFNKVFGYFIEVTKSNLNQVPERYIRKQTLTNAERYITEELKNLENQILGAEEKVVNGSIVITDNQTNGIGTHDRKWHSEEGKNITFTLIEQPFTQEMGDIADKLNGQLTEATSKPEFYFEEFSDDDSKAIVDVLKALDDYIENKDSSSLENALQNASDVFQQGDLITPFATLILSGMETVGMAGTNEIRTLPLFSYLHPYLQHQGGFIKFAYTDGHIEQNYTIRIGINTKSIVFMSQVSESLIDYVRTNVII